MKVFKFLMPILAAGLVFVSCDDDDSNDNDDNNNETEERITKDIKYINATSYTNWIYFSFEKGEIVEVEDPADDLSWDIAFHRGDIRLNGGESGSGKGEAVNTNSTQWDAITVAPESGYQKDETGKITSAFTGSGIEETDASFSQVLAGWITIDTSNPPPKYTYHDHIFVVKAANGNYTKLCVYDYTNEYTNGAYISFKYQYNKSSSNKFE